MKGYNTADKSRLSTISLLSIISARTRVVQRVLFMRIIHICFSTVTQWIKHLLNYRLAYLSPKTFKNLQGSGHVQGSRAVTPQLCTWWYDVEEIFEIIHPHFSQAPVVLVDDLARSSGEAVRGGLAENVSHMGTRYDFQRATALPHLQTHNKTNLLKWSVNHVSQQNCCVSCSSVLLLVSQSFLMSKHLNRSSKMLF